MGFYDSHAAFNLAVLNLVVYLGLGTVAFTYLFEKWTIVDAMYFSVVTLTTIGFGDLYPTTDEGRIFTCFFALYGIGILGIFLGVVGEKLVEVHNDILHGQRKQNTKIITNMLAPRHNVAQDLKDAKTQRLPKSAFHLMWKLFLLEAPIVLIVLFFFFMIGYFEKWSVIKTVYFSIISSTTVGYGDVTPNLQSMRCFCVIFLPLAVAVFCEVLGRIAGAYLEYRIDKREQAFLSRKLTAKDLEAMDVNKDGRVSWGEFLVFMLKAMDKVEEEELRELRQVFDRLDKGNDNALDKTDLAKNWKEKSREVAAELKIPIDDSVSVHHAGSGSVPEGDDDNGIEGRPDDPSLESNPPSASTYGFPGERL